MQASPDVQSARAKLRQARAQRRLAFGNLWPTINASSSAQHLKISQSGVEGAQNPGPNGAQNAGVDGSQDLYDIGFDASWEPDIVGGQRRALEAARADEEASAATLRQTRWVKLGQRALTSAVESARNAALLARHRYTSGLIDFQTVLDTERTVLTVEETLKGAEADNTTAVIQLYKALGGGWTPAEALTGANTVSKS
jgi:outer membrane protein TolC